MAVSCFKEAGSLQIRKIRAVFAILHVLPRIIHKYHPEILIKLKASKWSHFLIGQRTLKGFQAASESLEASWALSYGLDNFN